MINVEKTFTVNLEVTVPRILFPGSKPAPAGDDRSSSPFAEEGQLESTEQVRLISLNSSPDTHSRLEQTSGGFAEASGQMLQHAVHFQMFRVSDIPAGSGTLLCQLLRRDAPHAGDWRVADGLALTLDVDRAEISGNLEETREEPLLDAGTHLITFYVDEDGIPVSYRIDGAES